MIMNENGELSELRKLQLVQLDLLREVDRICRKHGIRYYISHGSLLGAVRHGGFIPWDDDLDVSMPYDEYLKFCEACKTDMNSEKYFLQNIDSDKDYNYVFAKLRRNNTLYVRKGQEHMNYHHGICIDVWVIYPVPINALAGLIFRVIVSRCKTIMWSPIGAISEKRKMKKTIYKLLSLIPPSIPKNVINFIVSKCSGEVLENIGGPSFGKTHVIKSKMANVNEYDYSVLLKKMKVNELVEMDFEDIKCYAPANYDYLLTYLYGNYMDLPERSYRQGHHSASKICFGDIFDNESPKISQQ